MKQRIMALNANDFGGITHHLMDHKYFNNRDRRYHIDWKLWAKQVDKTETWNMLKKYILEKNPYFLIIEEMLISCYERIDFLSELAAMGYFYMKESLPERGNYSLTMMFYKGSDPEYIRSPGAYRENRSVICRTKEIMLCGSHFPSESDEIFLKYMGEFVIAHLDEDFLLIGDLNANDPTRGNKEMINKLLAEGAVDLWTAAGNDEHTPTEAQYQGRLDYAIASPSLAKKVENIELDPFLMNEGITDHAAVIVDIVG